MQGELVGHFLETDINVFFMSLFGDISKSSRLRFLTLLAAQVEGAGFYKIFSFIAVTSYSGTFCSLHFVGCACLPLYFCFFPVCFFAICSAFVFVCPCVC